MGNELGTYERLRDATAELHDAWIGRGADPERFALAVEQHRAAEHALNGRSALPAVTRSRGLLGLLLFTTR